MEGLPACPAPSDQPVQQHHTGASMPTVTQEVPVPFGRVEQQTNFCRTTAGRPPPPPVSAGSTLAGLSSNTPTSAALSLLFQQGRSPGDLPPAPHLHLLPSSRVDQQLQRLPPLRAPTPVAEPGLGVPGTVFPWSRTTLA